MVSFTCLGIDCSPGRSHEFAYAHGLLLGVGWIVLAWLPWIRADLGLSVSLSDSDYKYKQGKWVAQVSVHSTDSKWLSVKDEKSLLQVIPCMWKQTWNVHPSSNHSWSKFTFQGNLPQYPMWSIAHVGIWQFCAVAILFHSVIFWKYEKCSF